MSNFNRVHIININGSKCLKKCLERLEGSAGESSHSHSFEPRVQLRRPTGFSCSCRCGLGARRQADHLRKSMAMWIYGLLAAVPCLKSISGKVTSRFFFPLSFPRLVSCSRLQPTPKEKKKYQTFGINSVKSTLPLQRPSNQSNLCMLGFDKVRVP